MKVPVYSVRDVNVGFMNPMCDVNDNSAKRNFAYAINNTDLMSFSPADYDLFRVGSFDSDTGVFDVLPIPELLVHGASVYGVN